MTDEKGKTWSPSGMSKVRTRPESLVADCSMHEVHVMRCNDISHCQIRYSILFVVCLNLTLKSWQKSADIIPIYRYRYSFDISTHL